MKINNATDCLSQLLTLLNVRVTVSTVRAELEQHPNFPSLLALSDVLGSWGVPSGAFQLEEDELSSVPTPFIAHLSVRGGEFTVVKDVDKSHVTISNDSRHNSRLSLEEFRKLFTGFVLAADPQPGAGEQNYLQKRRKEVLEAIRIPAVLIGFVLVASAFLFQSFFSGNIEWRLLLLTFTKAVGVTASILLLIQSIDANNPLIQRLCSGGNGNGCNAVLSSKAARLTEGLSWSEIGFFYFAGTSLALFFYASSTALLQTLAMLNLLCLPYTLYSVYYQYRVARKWCVLCCTVQALLWLESALFFPFFGQTLVFPNPAEWIGLLACLALPVLLWTFVKPFLLKAHQLGPLKEQLRVFKYNASMFERALSEQPCYALPNETDSIILGNPKSQRIITMVSNPYCPPCTRAHQTLEEWLSSRDDLQLRIVFTTNEDQQDVKSKVARHLMDLNRQNKALVRQALHSWYSQERKDYEAWARLYPVQEGLTEDLSLENQRVWCMMANISFTPTILINGHRLPYPYRLEDIKYFI